MSYDQKCYDLAKAFLSEADPPGTETEIVRLAQDIQQTIEDFLDYGRGPK